MVNVVVFEDRLYCMSYPYLALVEVIYEVQQTFVPPWDVRLTVLPFHHLLHSLVQQPCCREPGIIGNRHVG